MEVYKKLGFIQQNLKAPKDQFNSFGGYKYRSCESILEAVKPLLAQTNTTISFNDSIMECGGRVYVMATVTLRDVEKPDNYIMAIAYAREEETKKGMDASQVTGAASSYARKYALNGLFCIDDNKDSDATNTHGKDTQNATKPQFATSATGKFVPTCAGCGVQISDAEHDYSVKKYKRPLCRTCQKKEG